MDALKNRSFASYLLINHIMILHILINVCERLFDELVKEWLQNRYTIVSGTFRETNGCKVRIRKGYSTTLVPNRLVKHPQTEGRRRPVSHQTRRNPVVW